MFVELHILQNFAPSNLNRDETGTPKSCEFGGYRRARVSSQSLKRAARTYVKERKLLGAQTEDKLGARSLLLKEKLKRLLIEGGKAEDAANYVANFVFSKVDWLEDGKDKSGYLQFLGKEIIEQIKDLCMSSWSDFEESVNLLPQIEEAKEAVRSAKNEVSRLKRAIRKNDTPEFHEQLKRAEVEQAKSELQGTQKQGLVDESEKKLGSLVKRIDSLLALKQTPDVAMFGRMITDAPKYSISAASQVAHAISTHTVQGADFDYYTAIDELKRELYPETDAGAAMIGATEFNSACYYRYANIDLNQLSRNLKDANDDWSKVTVEAFLKSFVIAVPSGKQNSFASPTLPTFIMFVVREHGLCSLANAFAKPARPSEENDVSLIEDSVQRLTQHYHKLENFYGGIVGTKLASAWTEAPEFITAQKEKSKPASEAQSNKRQSVAITTVDSLEELIEKTVAAAFSNTASEGEPEA